MHRWRLAWALAGAVLAATVFPGAAAGRVSATCGSFGPESGTVELGKPATYTASAGGNHSMSVTVSWGDGSSSNTSLSSGGSDTLSHVYGQVGTYTTLVTISGILPDGTTPCGNSVPGSVTVTSPPAPPQSPPKAVYAASASTQYVGEVVIFSGGQSSDPDNDIASYGWNFGDGATFSGVVAPHVYSKAGTYTVNLTVTDSGGRSDSTSGAVTITDKPVDAPPNPFPPTAPPPAPTPPVATPPVQPLAPNAPSSPALGNKKTQLDKDKWTDASILLGEHAAEVCTGAGVLALLPDVTASKIGAGTLAIICGIEWKISQKLAKWANDPPDAAFTTVARPGKVSIPRIRASKRVSRRAAAALNALFGNMAKESSLVVALTHAAERDQGALAAGDLTAAAKQEAAGLRYAATLSRVIRARDRLRRRAATALKASGLRTLANRADLRRAQRMARRGLPASVRRALTGLLTPSERAGVGSAARRIDPRTVKVASLAAVLTNRALIRSDRAVADAFARLAS